MESGPVVSNDRHNFCFRLVHVANHTLSTLQATIQHQLTDRTGTTARCCNNRWSISWLSHSPRFSDIDRTGAGSLLRVCPSTAGCVPTLCVTVCSWDRCITMNTEFTWLTGGSSSLLFITHTSHGLILRNDITLPSCFLHHCSP